MDQGRPFLRPGQSLGFFDELFVEVDRGSHGYSVMHPLCIIRCIRPCRRGAGYAVAGCAIFAISSTRRNGSIGFDSQASKLPLLSSACDGNADNTAIFSDGP